MVDHFSLLAPIYERIIPPPDPSVLGELLALTPECVLLDSAGGTGRASCAFVSQVARVVVCDTSTRMLAQAQRKGIETVEAELENLPFEDALFDRILLVDAFHHVKEQRLTISELLRVLKPDGRLVIEEPDIRLAAVKLVALLEKALLMRSRFFKPDRMVGMIAACGGRATVVRESRFRVWLSVSKIRDANSP